MMAYWSNQVGDPQSPWANFFNGDKAIATTYIPYYVGAAIRGTTAGFNQLKACDTPGTMNHLIAALGGSMVVAAGRVIFGWVPRTPQQFAMPSSQTNPTGPSVSGQYTIWCDDMVPGDEIMFDAANDAEAQGTLAHVQSNSSSECCLIRTICNPKHVK